MSTQGDSKKIMELFFDDEHPGRFKKNNGIIFLMMSTQAIQKKESEINPSLIKVDAHQGGIERNKDGLPALFLEYIVDLVAPG
jgi:hypothetical protein